MNAMIKVFSIKEPMITRETYGTIKRRLSNTDAFIEVTDSEGKLMINKGAIEMVGQSEKKATKKLKK